MYFLIRPVSVFEGGVKGVVVMVTDHAKVLVVVGLFGGKHSQQHVLFLILRSVVVARSAGGVGVARKFFGVVGDVSGCVVAVGGWVVAVGGCVVAIGGCVVAVGGVAISGADSVAGVVII